MKPLPCPDLDSCPLLVVVASCHNGAESLPGLVGCLRAQEYPSSRYRFIALIDNCSDRSLDVARSLGVEVYERNNPQKLGKGFALNDLLEKKLQDGKFDGLVLLDIDARFDSRFLLTAAHRLLRGDSIIQGSSRAKNASESGLKWVGDIILGLLKVHQIGRSHLGLPPLLIGSHGICISYGSLSRLDWKIDTGQTADDLELSLRAFLKGISMVYVPDLVVWSEVPEDFRSIRRQRRRWTCNSLRMAPQYFHRLFLAIFSAPWRAADLLFVVLLGPSFSNLLLVLTLTSAAMGFWALLNPAVTIWFFLFFVLWILDFAYFIAAFAVLKEKITFRRLLVFLRYLGVRGMALAESIFLVGSKNWWPTKHYGDGPENFIPGQEQGD